MNASRHRGGQLEFNPEVFANVLMMFDPLVGEAVFVFPKL